MKTIIDTATDAGRFTTLLNALKAAALTETLRGAGPYTVFAPTDEAFKQLAPGVLNALLKDTKKLKAILTYHVVPGTVAAYNMKAGDIKTLEPNIHAGVKLMRTYVDRYFANEPMDEVNKVLFGFAAYNAGPGRVRQLRREAAARGLDRNVWFNNVERIASERIGRETVTYVSNIYKYYVTYLLIQGEYLNRQNLKRATAPSGGTSRLR